MADPVHQTTIQPGDRVRVIGAGTREIYTVKKIAPPPPEVPQAGPIAFFVEGGFWRVVNLEAA